MNPGTRSYSWGILTPILSLSTVSGLVEPAGRLSNFRGHRESEPSTLQVAIEEKSSWTNKFLLDFSG